MTEIHRTLGEPTGDASAKQFQEWIEPHWWGMKVLTVTATDIQKQSTYPAAIDYRVYVNGKYSAVYRTIILNKVFVSKLSRKTP
jgi:hypothetical protein